MNKLDLFNGRISRTSFLIGLILTFIVLTGISTIFTLILGNQAFTANSFSALLMILFVFIGLFYVNSISIRRLHDFNKTGVWTLAYFTGLGGAILPLVLLVVPGSKGVNKYGSKPSLITLP